ncbi:hypothetical protein AALP_AA8G310000 [Arabis alpina]|uniref:DYW domain-containing protein n=1 Tax=Arabis alpina TaxID=50452 RepID=A0A087GAL1_ARAAL|nr:hypothetical protein AALP_AA8G310000 [Arabis alpina]
MDAYFQNQCFEEALNLFAKMETKEVRPNEFTFAVVLNSIAELSLLKHGDLLHGLVVKSGFRNHVMVGNALVNMYAKCGSIEGARKAFSVMTFRDIVTWNTMICGLTHHGLGKEAIEAFDKMMIAGQFPNRITFISVLQACSHIGYVEQGLYYFNQLMKQFGVEPDLRHYTCIVRLLSKAGLFEEVENFMKTAPIEWDVVAWRSLLNACYVRRNYSLGKRVAEFAIEMYPNDSGMYILLSNIHGKLKEWEDVARVRSLMKKRRVKKEPGVSWIDEEQRESNLSHHSEKLAVAYGLMKTPENSPLKLVRWKALVPLLQLHEL